MSALEFGKEQIAIVELEKKIDAESETVEERRQRIENELNVPTEEQGTFDIALDDIAWLESKTGCRIEEIHRLSSEYDNLAGLFYQNPDDEELKKAFEYYGDKLESMLSETKKYLQSVLARQQKQSVKSSMGVPVKHIQPCARTASRARRSVARPTGGGGGGPGGDDDDGDPDSSDSDPPGPGARARNAHFLNLSKNPYFKPENGQLSHRSWRMSSEGRHAA
jgi:hypothetical protein